MSGAHGIVCTARVYQFEGWLFEFHPFCGPTTLRKTDLEPRARQPLRENHPFWGPFERWFALSDEEKVKTIYLSGGCRRV